MNTGINTPSKEQLGSASESTTSFANKSIARVLVSTSDMVACERLKEILKSPAFDLTCANSGRSALEYLQHTGFDLVIVERLLPDITGLDILGFVQTVSEEPTPVILMGEGILESDDFALSLARGAENYWAKPLDVSTVLWGVKSALRTAATMREKKALVREIRKYGQRLQTIVDNVPGVVWESVGGLDISEHRLTFTSNHAQSFPADIEFNAKRRTGLGLHLIHPDDREAAVRSMHHVLQTRTSSMCEFRVLTAEGGVIPMETYLSGIYDEENYPVGLRGISIDITERHRAEVELRRAKEQAEAANNTKDQFIAVLSHELRTPLTPVLTTIEMLETDTSLPASVRPLIQILRRNVELEARLIDDLLDLTKITKGKVALSLKPVSLDDVIRNVLEICAKELREKSLVVNLQLEAQHTTVLGDETRLQQVFWNLIHNAAKFTPRGGNVTINSRNRTNDSNAVLNVTVTDSGIGIDPEILPLIFSPFEQGDLLITKQFGGLGLGLAISHNLISLHGGVVSASSPGKNLGSSFSVELPVLESGIPDEPVAGAPPKLIKKKKILLVDDHVDTGRVIQLLLERRGFEVERALSVRSALDLSDRFSFDLLISDIGLPDGNGYDLIETIQARKGDVLAIALSGFGTMQDISRSMSAGFKIHITKPFNFPDLQKKIEELLQA